jgi:hypothetical protein
MILSVAASFHFPVFTFHTQHTDFSASVCSGYFDPVSNQRFSAL